MSEDFGYISARLDPTFKIAADFILKQPLVFFLTCSTLRRPISKQRTTLTIYGVWQDTLNALSSQTKRNFRLCNSQDTDIGHWSSLVNQPADCESVDQCRKCGATPTKFASCVLYSADH